MATVAQYVQTEVEEKILRLKREKNAVILAHNYQVTEVQEIADYVGDSLGLSQEAARTTRERIVFCGVHFMAETASILCPDKKVLIPDLEAGCSLAASVNADQLRAWKAKHPDAVVVSYVNTSAEVKAESDYCCTSSNAVNVVNAIPRDREILFLPDMYLGAYVQEVTRRKLHLWLGECHVHAGIRPDQINAMRKARPEAEMLVHPECGCTTSFLYYQAACEIPGKTHFCSTEGMIHHALQSPAREFIVATETGILHRMKKAAPEKQFYPASKDAVCLYMKKITLEKVLRSLEEDVFEVNVPEETAGKARLAIERMLQLV
ncbi:MAG: quinolinate synthase NadA [Acidobacteria bacterium]|nr:quinolinate synthase NadA [Acidobacteriota bacterium]